MNSTERIERMEIIAVAVRPTVLHQNLMRAVDGDLKEVGDWIIDGDNKFKCGNRTIEVVDLKLNSEPTNYTRIPKLEPISAEFEYPSDIEEYRWYVSVFGHIERRVDEAGIKKCFRVGRAFKTEQEAIKFLDTEQDRIRYQQVCARLRAAYPLEDVFALDSSLKHSMLEHYCRAHSGGFPESQYEFIREHFSDDVLMRIHGWVS